MGRAKRALAQAFPRANVRRGAKESITIEFNGTAGQCSYSKTGDARFSSKTWAVSSFGSRTAGCAVACQSNRSVHLEDSSDILEAVVGRLKSWPVCDGSDVSIDSGHARRLSLSVRCKTAEATSPRVSGTCRLINSFMICTQATVRSCSLRMKRRRQREGRRKPRV